MCSSRRGPPARSTRRTLSASTACPPKSTSRTGEKMSGSSRESWFSSAVVWYSVVIPSSRSTARSATGESSSSRPIPTSVAPLSSAPHVSNASASKLAFDACATRSPGPSRT